MAKITIAKTAGFCVGVKRAIEMALDAARECADVRMLGDIVHNETVVAEIGRAGIHKIARLGRGAGKTLLIRAHGEPKKIFERARRAGYTVIDATCPMVKGIHRIAERMEREGRVVIVIGDPDHDEVRGIIGQLAKKAFIVNDSENLPRALSLIRRAGVVVQSTQDHEKVARVVARLKKSIPDLVYNDTICNPTRTKQREAKELPLYSDVVIVIGSRTSANTRRLYEISVALNERTHWVNSPEEIRPSWLRAVLSVGILAGASTPDTTIRTIARRIRTLTSTR